MRQPHRFHSPDIESCAVYRPRIAEDVRRAERREVVQRCVTRIHSDVRTDDWRETFHAKLVAGCGDNAAVCGCSRILGDLGVGSCRKRAVGKADCSRDGLKSEDERIAHMWTCVHDRHLFRGAVLVVVGGKGTVVEGGKVQGAPSVVCGDDAVAQLDRGGVAISAVIAAGRGPVSRQHDRVLQETAPVVRTIERAAAALRDVVGDDAVRYRRRSVAREDAAAMHVVGVLAGNSPGTPAGDGKARKDGVLFHEHAAHGIGPATAAAFHRRRCIRTDYERVCGRSLRNQRNALRHVCPAADRNRLGVGKHLIAMVGYPA